MGVTVEHGGSQLSKRLLQPVDGVVEFFQGGFLALGLRTVVCGVNLPALHGDAFDQAGVEHAQQPVRINDFIPDQHLPGKGSPPGFIPGLHKSAQVGSL